MTAVEDRPAREANPSAGAADRPIGFGRIQRKEDPRFVRGKGNYIDDIVLPGMLHGAILRSPMAHARLVSIDTTTPWRAKRRSAAPGVEAGRDAVERSARLTPSYALIRTVAPSPETARPET